jgi:hypothetical protein
LNNRFGPERRLRSRNPWNWANRAANPQRLFPTATFFSAVGRPVEPLSLSLALENNFLSGALGKAGLFSSAKR